MGTSHIDHRRLTKLEDFRIITLNGSTPGPGGCKSSSLLILTPAIPINPQAESSSQPPNGIQNASMFAASFLYSA